jgi:aspartyl protease family protein
MATWIALLLLVTAGIALVAGEGATVAGFALGEAALPLAIIGLVMFLFVMATGPNRGRFAGAIRDFAVWTGLALVLIAGYSYRAEITTFAYRMAGELAPPGETVTLESRGGERTVRIRRRPEGHFHARTEVNGVKLRMLIDTGATSIVLKHDDAHKVGLDPRRLSFSVPVQTANGTTYAAPVRLRSVGVGSIGFTEIDALVARPGALSESLLGMNFLSRLRSYEFSGEFLTLRG